MSCTFLFPNPKKKSYNAESHNVSVVVQARVGKEFPDTRQNERRIKFIRVGRGESLPAQQAGFLIVRESRRWETVIHFYTLGVRNRVGVLRVICWLDEACILGRRKSRANTFSLWGRRGDRLYCSINSYNMGEGRMIRVWFFIPAFQDPPWFYLLFRPWVTTLSKMTYWMVIKSKRYKELYFFTYFFFDISDWIVKHSDILEREMGHVKTLMEHTEIHLFIYYFNDIY